ncbi:zinc transporter ZIP3-like [Chironomus tepperi]|uniref:zinc transporter ZIP3-like n=1 Tax=Chironomus tepperi TaxID=113505 RepID=UPI00391EF239
MTDYYEEDGALMAKIISGSALFLVSLIFGIVPFKLAKVFKWSEPFDPDSKSNKKSSRVVSALLCFGGGVLLATTFLHLLPDINGEIAHLQEEGKIPELHISLGECLMMLGFFLIYLIEEIVHYYLHRYQQSLQRSQASVATMKPEEETFAEAFMRGISARNSVHRRFSDSNGCLQITNSRRGSVILEDGHDLKTLGTIAEKGQIIPTIEKTEKNNTSGDHHHVHSHNQHTHSHNQHGHSHNMPVPHSEDEDLLVSSLRGLLIVLALSLHELFEGFAVGLQRDTIGVYYMFGAVCAHKFVISFCIGVELMVQKTKMWLAFIYVFVYSIVSALGILVGAVLTTGSYGETLQVPNIILQGLATGTLLYVIFFEVLSKDRSGLIPYLSIFFGFAIMLGLQYIAAVTESKGIQGANASFESTTSTFLHG